MTTLAAFALLATAQGPYGPIGPINPGTIVVPPYPTVSVVNLIENAGFEKPFPNDYEHWTTWGLAKYSGYGNNETISGHRASGNAHGGVYAFAMGAHFPYLNSSALTAMTAVDYRLDSTVLGSAIFGASVWVNCPQGILTVRIRYTDATATKVSAAFSTAGGWQRWDFRNAINPDKWIMTVEFSKEITAAQAQQGLDYEMLLDDASLIVLRPR